MDQAKILTAIEKKKVVLILLIITLIEGTWVLFTWWRNGIKFWNYMGFSSQSSVWGWIACVIVILFYLVIGIRLPSVKQYLTNISWLKFLALWMAFSSGILEEVFFRKELMNFLKVHDYGSVLQVIFSGLIFGLIHGVWGLFGKNIRAAIGAAVATGILGFGLAFVFLASGRNLAPCIIAHFLINVLMEPGLVISAVKGEMTKKIKT